MHTGNDDVTGDVMPMMMMTMIITMIILVPVPTMTPTMSLAPMLRNAHDFDRVSSSLPRRLPEVQARRVRPPVRPAPLQRVHPGPALPRPGGERVGAAPAAAQGQGRDGARRGRIHGEGRRAAEVGSHGGCNPQERRTSRRDFL